MSVNGYICIEITTDAKYEEEARRWAKEHFYGVNAGRDGKLTIDGDGDVSYLYGGGVKYTWGQKGHERSAA